MSEVPNPLPEGFWYRVLEDIRVSRELMSVKDYAGALDIAKNAKERIESEGMWPKELSRPELQACFAIVGLIGELEKLAHAATPLSDHRKGLRCDTSHKAASMGLARP